MTGLLTTLILASSLWLTSNAVAGLSAPIPFAKLSADETRILVVRDGGEGFSESQLENPRLSSGDEINFLAEFPKSGVYRIASRKLIYEIDWFCLEHELLASDDLNDIARLNRFGGDWALRFYHRGIEGSSYQISQLLTSFADERFRPFQTWDYFHAWHEDFDLVRGQLVVTTIGREFHGFPLRFNEVHTFDLGSGALTHTEVHNGIFWLAIGLIGVLAFLMVSLLLAKLSKRNKEKQNKPEQDDAYQRPC